MANVSLIVPVYNVEDFLARCLDSCINQSYSDIEIICVNDGSTDDSLNILEHYQKLDSRIKIINKENGGLSSARNAGLNIAQGKYVMFVDSDDFISSVAIEKLFSNAEKYNSDFVIFDYINAKKDCSTQITLDASELSEGNIYNIDVIPGDLYNHIPISVWSKFYKTSFLKENKIFFDEGLIFEDVAFFPKVYTKAKRITYLKEPLYSYTLSRDGQIMTSRGKKLVHIFDVYEIAEKALIESGYYQKCRHALELSMVADIIWKFDIIDSELKPEFFSQILKKYRNIDYDYYKSIKVPDFVQYALRKYKSVNSVSTYDEFMKLKGDNVI